MSKKDRIEIVREIETAENYEISLFNLIELVQEKAPGVDFKDIFVHAHSYCDGEYNELIINWRELENDAEYQARMKREEDAKKYLKDLKKEREQNEYEQFLKLKKKFDKKEEANGKKRKPKTSQGNGET